MMSLTGSYPNETFPVSVWPSTPSETPLPPTTIPGVSWSCVPPRDPVTVWSVPVVLTETVNVPASVTSGMLTATVAAMLPNTPAFVPDVIVSEPSCR